MHETARAPDVEVEAVEEQRVGVDVDVVRRDADEAEAQRHDRPARRLRRVAEDLLDEDQGEHRGRERAVRGDAPGCPNTMDCVAISPCATKPQPTIAAAMPISARSRTAFGRGSAGAVGQRDQEREPRAAAQHVGHARHLERRRRRVEDREQEDREAPCRGQAVAASSDQSRTSRRRRAPASHSA